MMTHLFLQTDRRLERMEQITCTLKDRSKITQYSLALCVRQKLIASSGAKLSWTKSKELQNRILLYIRKTGKKPVFNTPITMPGNMKSYGMYLTNTESSR